MHKSRSAKDVEDRKRRSVIMPNYWPWVNQGSKCDPDYRIWPEKCNRCVAKNLLCSEPQLTHSRLPANTQDHQRLHSTEFAESQTLKYPQLESEHVGSSLSLAQLKAFVATKELQRMVEVKLTQSLWANGQTELSSWEVLSTVRYLIDDLLYRIQDEFTRRQMIEFCQKFDAAFAALEDDLEEYIAQKDKPAESPTQIWQNKRVGHPAESAVEIVESLVLVVMGGKFSFGDHLGNRNRDFIDEQEDSTPKSPPLKSWQEIEADRLRKLFDPTISRSIASTDSSFAPFKKLSKVNPPSMSSELQIPSRFISSWYAGSDVMSELSEGFGNMSIASENPKAVKRSV
jgi:hypothetical protein